MTLEQLRTFCAVVEQQSFSRAAEALFLTQPTVSQQVQALERDFGVRLFDRIGRRVFLTRQGEIMYKYAGWILAALDEARRLINDSTGLPHGQLRLGASLLVGTHVLPPVLGRMKSQYPELEVTLEMGFAWQMIERVKANKLDLALVGSAGHFRDDPSLDKFPFMKDRLALIVPPEHHWSHRDTVGVQELVGQPFILSEKGSNTRTMVEESLRQAGVNLVISMEFGNIEAIKRAVEEGLGLSILSEVAVVKEVRAGWLRTLRLADVSLERDLVAVWLKERKLSPAASALLEIIGRARW
ncbi:MAG: selenium metabolism-associated LysR family transcriptional regulator [Firmicutes bacterium]|nr:selenium metabolism-associated LysR family transcriptional regulator [Bacillota bacterium]